MKNVLGRILISGVSFTFSVLYIVEFVYQCIVGHLDMLSFGLHIGLVVFFIFLCIWFDKKIIAWGDRELIRNGIDSNIPSYDPTYIERRIMLSSLIIPLFFHLVAFEYHNITRFDPLNDIPAICLLILYFVAVFVYRMREWIMVVVYGVIIIQPIWNIIDTLLQFQLSFECFYICSLYCVWTNVCLLCGLHSLRMALMKRKLSDN